MAQDRLPQGAPDSAGGQWAGRGRSASAIVLDGHLPLTHVTADLTVDQLVRQMLRDGEEPLLAGIGGSTAYGLATPASDRDVLAVHIAPTRRVLGLTGDGDVAITRTSKDPDAASHEIGKFASLALKGNSTVLELLWFDGHGVTSETGAELVANRSAFLSEKPIRDAYTGYAIQQARRLQSRVAKGQAGFDPDLAKRTAKHARHCLRLLRSGKELLRTGDLMVDVSQWRDELFAAGELAEADPNAFAEMFERELADVDEIKSVLPAMPDRDLVNDIVVRARLRAL